MLWNKHMCPGTLAPSHIMRPKLDDQALTKHITKAYDAHHFKCIDALLMCSLGRKHLPCPKIPLVDSCKASDLINLTKLLVEKGQDVNADNGEPLQMAARHSNHRAVNYLLQNNAWVQCCR